MGFLISQNYEQIWAQSDEQARKLQAQRFIPIQVNGQHWPLPRHRRELLTHTSGVSDKSFELLEMVPLVFLMFAQEGLNVWRHILQLRRAYSPERHGFGLQKSLE
jgi:hypothetical protein